MKNFYNNINNNNININILLNKNKKIFKFKNKNLLKTFIFINIIKKINILAINIKTIFNFLQLIFIKSNFDFYLILNKFNFNSNLFF